MGNCKNVLMDHLRARKSAYLDLGDNAIGLAFMADSGNTVYTATIEFYEASSFEQMITSVPICAVQDYQYNEMVELCNSFNRTSGFVKLVVCSKTYDILMSDCNTLHSHYTAVEPLPKSRYGLCLIDLVYVRDYNCVQQHQRHLATIGTYCNKLLGGQA